MPGEEIVIQNVAPDASVRLRYSGGTEAAIEEYQGTKRPRQYFDIRYDTYNLIRL
jgi:hypothetical protein